MPINMHGIALNSRFYAHRPTGMQRYALELAARFGGNIQQIRPDRPLKGAAGHLWEQVYLPAALRGRMLWSPNNTGPLAVANQVCTFHDLIPLDRPEWFNPRFAAWCQWLLPRLARKVRRIISVSEFTKQRIVERCGIDASKITVIPNGVDARFHPRPAGEIAAMRESLGIGGAPYLLCVGSVEPRKNLPRLLNAWSSALAKMPEDVQLVVAGAKGAPLVFSNVAVGKLPARVRLTGYVNDQQLPALYSGAMALVYPSLYEGFGLPPLEAMACGVPVITSNGTSLPEVVGDAAVLADPSDIESISEAILRVTRDESLRKAMRAKGLARAERYRWDAVASKTWQVLSNC
ncbi:MAG: glycosyltransferase family 4 protein [Acidobacteriota bacterium]|nr:glycosyltransferase family 4 protein [Acidobacteriota bacterium]